MVSRVKFHEAQSAAARQTAANYDTDLIRISTHNTTTAICQEYEGKIFSISGKDKRFPILDQSPPFHVNCLHYETVTFEESLLAQGALDKYSEFSLGETDRPPTDPGFVPVSKRAGIERQAQRSAKALPEWKTASPKKRRDILRTEVGRKMGAAA